MEKNKVEFIDQHPEVQEAPEIIEKVNKLFEQKINEFRESEKKRLLDDKMDNVKRYAETFRKEKTDATVNCPTCKGHALKIEDNIAKCTGPECNKEYLLSHRTDKRKDYICTTCGHTIFKDDVEKLKGKNCPMCNKDNVVVNIDWKTIDEKMKQKKIDKK